MVEPGAARTTSLTSAQEPDQTTVNAPRQEAYSSTRTWIWLGIVLLLLAIAFLPSAININRYQHRIAQTISTSIGRPVQMSAVRLRLLPRPGFEISNFVVEEDPAFGAEPMLRSASVVASVRLVSIWRGRLEISRIQLDEPSLNLVRRGDGQWNFGSVLLKASSTPNAPTAQPHVSSAARFPYIEATNARINFKNGDEKKPFSFLNADLSVWLDNPDEWRLRFEAQPVRTDLDLDLADTGVLKIDGSVRRAPALNLVPVMLHAEWTKAPLGQLSRMFAGRDAGWRGDLEVRADISGTEENALLKTQLRATNVHRIEFAPREPMDLDANCQATYTRQTHSLEDVACTSPVGNGHLLLRGQLPLLGPLPVPGPLAVDGKPGDLRQGPEATLELQMQKVPVSAALGLARSMREGFAPNLKAVGSIDGGFQYSGEAVGSARLRGGVTVSGLELRSPLLERPLLLPALLLSSAADANTPAAEPGRHDRHGSHRRMAAAREAALLQQQDSETALILSPVGLPAGSLLPLQVDGRFTRAGYQMHLAGNANVKSLVAYSKAFGLLRYTMGPLAPTGTAILDLRTSGAWLTPISDSDNSDNPDNSEPDHPVSDRRVSDPPVSRPPGTDASAEGQLLLKNARVTTDYLAGPLDVLSAHAVFSAAEVNWDAASVIYGKLRADGTLKYSQACVLDCAATFRLKFAALDAGEAQATLLGGGGRTQFLDGLLARLDHRSHPWPALEGTLEAATFTLQRVAFHDTKLAIEIKGNQVAIQSFDGRTLGGSVRITGTLDASGEQPVYALEATFAKLNTAEIATLFAEKWEQWGEGQISGTTKLHLEGYRPEDLASSATGTFHWDWTQGSLPTQEAEKTEPKSELDDSIAAPTDFERWSAEGTIAKGKLTLASSTLIPPPAGSDGLASILGTISLNRELNLTLSSSPHRLADKNAAGMANDAASINNDATVNRAIKSSIRGAITGTLSQPRLQMDRAVASDDQAVHQVLTQ